MNTLLIAGPLQSQARSMSAIAIFRQIQDWCRVKAVIRWTVDFERGNIR